MTRNRLTEEQIQRMIASDPDAPEATDEQLSRTRSFDEAFRALADAMRKNIGGRPKGENPKVACRSDPDHRVAMSLRTRTQIFRKR